VRVDLVGRLLGIQILFQPVAIFGHGVEPPR
jgi:hypothetical protein